MNKSEFVFDSNMNKRFSSSIMYHGTPRGGFSSFKNGVAFFAKDEANARSYAYDSPMSAQRTPERHKGEPIVYKCKVSVNNTFDLTKSECVEDLAKILAECKAASKGEFYDTVRSILETTLSYRDASTKVPALPFWFVETEPSLSILKKHGYDSAYVAEANHQSLAVFDAEKQVEILDNNRREASKSTSANILLLVHPDCLSEQYGWTSRQAEEYLDKLEQHLPRFDFIITMKMQRVTQEWIDSLGEDKTKQKNHFKRLTEILDKYTDMVVLDNDLGRASLNNEIGNFLLEHPNTTIYLSGGYQDNCLREVAANLVGELGEFIKELGIKVKVFTPLVYYYSRGLGFKDEVKGPLPWWDKDWTEQYKEDQKQSPEKRRYKSWGGDSPIPGEYSSSRGDWWEGPVDKISGLERLRKILATKVLFRNNKYSCTRRLRTSVNKLRQVLARYKLNKVAKFVKLDYRQLMPLLSPIAKTITEDVRVAIKDPDLVYPKRLEFEDNHAYVGSYTLPLSKEGECVIDVYLSELEDGLSEYTHPRELTVFDAEESATAIMFKSNDLLETGNVILNLKDMRRLEKIEQEEQEEEEEEEKHFTIFDVVLHELVHLSDSFFLQDYDLKMHEDPKNAYLASAVEMRAYLGQAIERLASQVVRRGSTLKGISEEQLRNWIEKQIQMDNTLEYFFSKKSNKKLSWIVDKVLERISQLKKDQANQEAEDALEQEATKLLGDKGLSEHKFESYEQLRGKELQKLLQADDEEDFPDIFYTLRTEG